MAGRSVVFVRFAPWMTFRNAHPHDLMWPVSLLYARSVAAQRGWDATIIDLHVESLNHTQLLARVRARRPRVVFLDTMTPTAGYALEFARRLRCALPTVRIFGIGQHATEHAESLVFEGSAFDGALLGEHELSVGELLDNGAAQPVDGSLGFFPGHEGLVRTGGKRLIANLDDLPAIDPSPLRVERYSMRSTHVPRFGRQRWGYHLTSRGCPYGCTFCSATLRQSYGRSFRAHSPARVVGDMLRLHRDHGITAWYMIDDVFSLDRDRVLEICRLLAEADNRVPWVIQTRPDLIDRELLAALKRATCVGVKMGIESGNDRILKTIRKGAKKARVLDAAQAIREAGLFLTAYYMVGHPTETYAEMEETYAFAQQVKAGMIQVGFHTPYPGSESFERYRDKVHNLSELNHYETCHVNESAVDAATLKRFQRNFYLRYYLSPRNFARYLRHRLVYREADPDEWRLAFSTLKYLLAPRGLAGRGRETPLRVVDEAIGPTLREEIIPFNRGRRAAAPSLARSASGTG